jgi:116 kDa U5 small nuclear ribonucleoprotein component
MSLVMQNSKGKSYLLNVIDTPGHVNFIDEVSSSARLTDGVVLVVDVVEGVSMGTYRHLISENGANIPTSSQVMSNTETIIRMALQERQPIILVINKMDRLILELRLPPSEAFFKIKHTIEEVNTIIA